MGEFMMRKSLAAGIILLFIGTAIIPSTAQDVEKSSPALRGNTLYVGGSGPGNYSRIQDAVDNATDGDTVFVFDDSSPYNERVTVHKSIRLVGENQRTTVIDYRNTYVPMSTTVSLTADDVTFTGFTVRTEAMLVGYNLNVYCNHSTIMGNTFIGNRSHTPFSFNIVLGNSHDNIIEENTISAGAVGIYVYESNDSTILANNITKNNLYGIILSNARRNNISMNNIIENGDYDAFVSRDLGIFPLSNHWFANYWGNPHLLPKRIPGQMILLENDHFTLTLPLVNVDWHPAQQPYNIRGTS